MLQHLRILLVLVVFGLIGCNDNSAGSNVVGLEPLQPGLQTMTSGGKVREYFLRLPSDGDGADKPLIFALHGYTGSYLNWVGGNRAYDLIDVVGDGAVIVVPQALEDASGNTIWGGQADLDFFINLIAELDLHGLKYNPNKIFVAGHSNGGGFTHELGCTHGGVFRAIVTASGGLSNNDCVGSVAVIMFHGENDPLTSGAIADASRRYWVLYNGWDLDAFVPAYEGLCENYSFPDQPDNVAYPVLWCLHDQGHAFPDFGSATAWNFLKGLPEVEPQSGAPPGGGAVRATPPRDALLTFQVDVPAAINRPLSVSASLRQVSFIDNPTCSAPDIIMTPGLAVDGLLIPGQLSERITFPFTYNDWSGVLTYPSDWALSLTIYVEGGSTGVIPTPGVDYNTFTPVTLVSRNTDLIIDQVLSLEPVADLCVF